MVKSIPVLMLIFLFAKCNNPEDDTIITRENAKKGEILFNSVGCTLCHSVSGESRYGPPLNLIFDKKMVVIRKGRKLSIKQDRKYIIRSIKYPEFEKLIDYQNKKMPSVNISPEDIDYIADYLIYLNTNKERTDK